MIAAVHRVTAPQRRVYLAKDYNYDEMVRNFERDADRPVEKYPDVEFDIYFTPYSICSRGDAGFFAGETARSFLQANSYMLRRLGNSPMSRCTIFASQRDHARSQQLFRHDPSIAAIDLKVLELIARINTTSTPQRPMQHRWSG